MGSRAKWIAAVFGVGVLAALLWASGLLSGVDAGLAEALERRGLVLVAPDSALLQLRVRGTRLRSLAGYASVQAAAAAGDGPALAREMRAAGVTAIAVEPGRTAPDSSVQARLGRFEHVDGLRGLYVSPTAAVYTHDIASELSARDRNALLEVARGLLDGARPPRVSSFPEPLSRLRHVEVMVLLRRGPRARLWRSARGSSLARALITAASVAKSRWDEREQAMGGPLDARLALLTLEVSLLQDDGTLGVRSAPFLRQAFHPQHAVAYERAGAWRYLLPEMMAEYASPEQAYAALLRDNGHEPSVLGAPDVRLYRLAISPLVSGPARRPAPDDGLGQVAHPDQVLPP